MAANITTGQRQSADGAAGSDDRVSEQLRATFKDLLRPNPQPKPGGDLHEVMAGIGRHLQNESLAIKTISDRLLVIENQTKKRSSRWFARYLLAICIGAAAILAWQSYGEAAKQMFAAKAPELGWSPETKQMIANWVEQLGWTKPPATPERTAVRSSATETPQATSVEPENVTPKAPAAPSVDPEQVHQIAMDLTALRQTVDQLAANQDKIGRNIDRLQAADQEILVKIPESPPSPPIAAAPAVPGRPAPAGAPPSENAQNTAPTSASLPVGHAVTDGALRASCGPDMQRLCGEISRENGGVIKCLSSHRVELSPTCDAYFNKMPVQRSAQKGAPKATSPNQ
jgi:Cysteine rich repeat